MTSSSPRSASLAVFGAAPAFAEPLCVGRPNVGNKERLLERIGGAIDRRWLTNDGPLLLEFEKSVAEVCGGAHCVATCNGTAAIEIMARALGLTGEVIVPSFTFVATAHALDWLGIKPVFCDIDARTHNIDPKQVESLITPRTSAIMGVHLWGRACDAEALADIANRHQLKLLFDGAHAFGCTYKGAPIAEIGDATALSFHATKFVNAGEGGAVVTQNRELASTMRRMRNFGFAGFDHVVSPGINGKMSELSAAMGLTSIESMRAFIRHNRKNYEMYREALSEIPGLKLVEYDDAETNNFQYVIVEVDASLYGLERDDLVTTLVAENVIARRYFYPGCHRMAPYAEREPETDARLPQTNALAARILALPTGTAVSPENIALLARILRDAHDHAADVRKALLEN